MKSDIQLFEEYKVEKAIVVGAPDERTGLEDFPSFKEWKLEYMKEYAETHDMENPVSMEEAVALLESELEAAADDDLLSEEDLEALAADKTPETQDEENTMSEDVNATEAAEATEATATTEATEAPAKPKRKSTGKKKAVKKVAAKKRPPSKAADAQKVFDRLYPKVLEGKKARKDVIEEFVSKVGLTANGAATYFQKLKTAYAKANGK